MHVLLLVIFAVFHIMPLFYFNILSVITYAVCFWLMWGDREHYLTIYLITFIEVMLHSFAATIVLGWQYGFAQYIIAIVPVRFLHLLHPRHQTEEIYHSYLVGCLFSRRIFGM